MKVGAQLFTVREFTKTSEDFANTMKKIAEMGYDCIQYSGVSANITAAEVKEICDANGLEIVITHTPPDRIKNDTAAVIADHKTMGAKYVGLGAIPGHYGHTKEGFIKFVEEFTPAAKAIKEAGLQFMYHNHDFEFIRFDGISAYEYMANNFADAGFTVDTFWVQAGGADPAYWIKKLAGRADVIHLKDFVIVEGKRRMAEVFEGNLNWDAILEAAKATGVKYAMVEQDDCNGQCPFECLQTSYQNLKKRGIV